MRSEISSRILSRLNIHCTLSVTQYCTTNNDSSFTWPGYCGLPVLQPTEHHRNSGCSIHENFNFCFIRSRTSILNLSQIDILCTSALKRCYVKNNSTVYTFHLFSNVAYRRSTETCHLSLAKFLLWRVV